ncbi:MAG TPA: outer membrane beta-barrel protein [Casimicrobiaceae bacterium]|nr:outer membrane beta-barrel protein [Casimicrobiaceae bacterium]
MASKQFFAAVALSAFSVASTAVAEAPKTPPTGLAGFYGGVSLRDAGTESQGLDVGQVASTWGRYASPVSDDSARRALVFGGYRFANDIAVEGSITSAESYALRPFDSTMRRGVGLSLANNTDLATHAWNADVYTSWSLRKSFSLYGRLGYAQSDAIPAYALAALPMGDPRRLREGVNYGVGLRYDVTPALGLRLEYARFPRFAGEAAPGPLPDSDQVQFGLQLRF